MCVACSIRVICVLVSSLSKFWTKACVEESLDALLLYLFSYVVFPYMLTSNAFNSSN
jgi:hypothetical protein